MKKYFCPCPIEAPLWNVLVGINYFWVGLETKKWHLILTFCPIRANLHLCVFFLNGISCNIGQATFIYLTPQKFQLSLAPIFQFKIYWVFLHACHISDEIQMPCSQPNSISYGMSNWDGRSKISRFACFQGYHLVGPPQLECRYGQWYPTTYPICKPIVCNQPHITNGRYAMITGVKAPSF